LDARKDAFCFRFFGRHETFPAGTGWVVDNTAMNRGIAGRVAAAGVAALAWAGLVVQCVVLYHQNSSVLLTLWIVLAFFTITTNLLVAAVFTGIAANRRALCSGWVVAGTMLSILLVGVIYVLLLHGMTELSGGSAVANALLHFVTPIVVPLFWIFFVDKGELTWRHPLLWAIYPLAYLAYSLTRGAATGKYPYPFIDVLLLGWKQTALNCVWIALAFMLSSFATVWIDHHLGPKPPARS
jgi:hypothetical protein